MTKIQEHFEANMLDGQDINDCGKAMLDAKYVLEHIEEYYTLQSLQKETNKEVEIKKENYVIVGCPNCGWGLDTRENANYIYCPGCGAKIKWLEEPTYKKQYCSHCGLDMYGGSITVD